MKILLVTPYYYPKIGGLEIYARQMALALRDRHGAQITIVTSNHTSGGTVVDEVDGMTIYRLGAWFKVSNTPVNPLWYFTLRRIIRDVKPSIIHAHTPVPSMADAAALASGSIPFVLTDHAASLAKPGSVLFNVLASAYAKYQALTFARASKIIAVSDFVRASLPARVQPKTDVVTNAVWADTVAPRRQPETGAFVFISSLDRTHAWKGLDAVLAAIALSKARLIVIGDGNDRARYEQLAEDLDITDRVDFQGALTGDAKTAVLSRALGLIAYPTTTNDAFPTVFLEAWAAGVPVIAARIGALGELINDGRTGLLVAPSQPPVLAQAIDQLAADLKLRDHLAASARQLVASAYTWEIQADRMHDILEALA